MKLTAHLGLADDGLDLKVLVNPSEPQIYPLAELAAHAAVIETDITVTAVHRCRELARLIAAAEIMLAEHPDWGANGVRFDVMVVDAAGAVRRIADAFRAE